MISNSKKPYHVSGIILEVVDQKKGLWIITSSDLKCSQQCLYAYNKVN